MADSEMSDGSRGDRPPTGGSGHGRDERDLPDGSSGTMSRASSSRKRSRSESLHWTHDPLTGTLQHPDGCHICDAYLRHLRQAGPDESYAQAVLQRSHHLRQVHEDAARLLEEELARVQRSSEDALSRLNHQVQQLQRNHAEAERVNRDQSRRADDLRRELDGTSRKVRRLRQENDRLRQERDGLRNRVVPPPSTTQTHVAGVVGPAPPTTAPIEVRDDDVNMVPPQEEPSAVAPNPVMVGPPGNRRPLRLEDYDDDDEFDEFGEDSSPEPSRSGSPERHAQWTYRRKKAAKKAANVAKNSRPSTDWSRAQSLAKKMEKRRRNGQTRYSRVPRCPPHTDMGAVARWGHYAELEMDHIDRELNRISQAQARGEANIAPATPWVQPRDGWTVPHNPNVTVEPSTAQSGARSATPTRNAGVSNPAPSSSSSSTPTLLRDLMRRRPARCVPRWSFAMSPNGAAGLGIVARRPLGRAASLSGPRAGARAARRPRPCSSPRRRPRARRRPR